MNKLLYNMREWFDVVKNIVILKLVCYFNGKYGLFWKIKDFYYMY